MAQESSRHEQEPHQNIDFVVGKSALAVSKARFVKILARADGISSSSVQVIADLSLPRLSQTGQSSTCLVRSSAGVYSKRASGFAVAVGEDGDDNDVVEG
jgi:hypothetical protein